MIGKPVVLSSAYNFSAGVGAIGSPADPANLRSPSNRAMLVEDISVWIAGGYGATPDVWHEWEIKIGRARLTDGFVPIAGCVRREDSIHSYSYAGSFAMRAYLWTLPRPLYVPSGAVLQVKLKSAVANAKAVVSIRGRVLPQDGSQDPATVPVTYAAVWRPGVFGAVEAETDVTQYIYKSVASDLSNPFEFPLNVVRFIAGSNEGAAESDEMGSGRQNADDRYFPRVQMYHSNGAPILRDMTHLINICSLVRSEWPAKFILQPKDVVFVTADQTHAAAVTQAQDCIGMVGWRETPISEVR